MSDVREATEDLLSRRPELEGSVRSLLEVETDPPWEFEDLPVDTGEFGELVSAGLIEEADGGYVLTDPDAIAVALDGSPTGDGGSTRSNTTRNVEVPSLGELGDRVAASRLELAVIGAALAFTALVRTVFHYGSVFRREHIVMAGNDPYLFVYWVEFLLTEGFGPFDPGSLSSFPPELIDHDLLLVIVVWFVATILGGTTVVADVLLAWYPVVASVVVGGILYVIATRLTADRRVGLAAIGIFALTPAVSYRMMIGFADHDAIDFVFLSLTLLSLFVLVTRGDEDTGGWRTQDFAAIVGLGVGVAAQLIAWRGGPILVFPLALTLAVLVVSALRTSAPARELLAPVVAGLSLASLLTMVPHLAFGWLPLYRAGLPLLLIVGIGALAAFATAVRRYELSLRVAVGSVAGLFVLAVIVAWALVPPLSAAIQEFLNYMAIYTWSDIAETQSLFNAGGGIVFAPFLLLGLGFVLGLGGLVAGSMLAYRRHSPGWLVLVVYGWFFLVMAVVQSRFAGQFALVNSVLAGVGFVHLAAIADVARPVEWVPTAEARAREGVRRLSVPDRSTVLSIALLFLLVSSLGIVQTPVKQTQVAVEDRQYDAATFVEEFADEREMAYPENYVLSRWGDNRFYNYVVSGESHSYQFAQSNYESFLAATNGSRAYERFHNRTGFVVTTDQDGEFGSQMLQTRVHEAYESANESAPALDHYRAIYTAPDRSLTVSQLVPGATVEGTGPANETITVSTTVTLPPADRDVTYEQRARTDSNGEFSFVTPYPGSYSIAGESVTVSEDAVESGASVTMSGGASG